MRIGMMTDIYKPYISGVTNYIEISKRYLERLGHEVFIFTFGDLEYEDKETRVYRSPGVALADTGFYLSMQYSREAKQALQTMDVAHVHHPFLSGQLALRYCRLMRIPIVYTNHTRYDLYARTYLPLMPEQMSHAFLQTYMPSFCEAVQMTVAPSAGMAQILKQLNVKAQVEVIPNGVELARFRKAQPHRRESFGYKKDDLILIYSGRIAPEKNLPFLLKAFARIAQALPRAKLALIGGGTPAYESEISELIEELHIAQSARMFGKVEYETLPAYLAMGDIFTTASVTEVHPLSLIEAMGAGLPTVGVRSVGVGDVIIDGITGKLTSHDLPAYTTALMRLCMDGALRQRMSLASRQAAERYDIALTSQTMLAHYERLAADAQRQKTQRGLRLREVLETRLKNPLPLKKRAGN
ncbi:MAG: glycosyltransferase family 4 protein [Anaerolineales bacterium]